MKIANTIKFIVLIVALAASYNAQARSSKSKSAAKIKAVSGTIYDQSGDGIFGALVQIYGTNDFTFSDQQGHYAFAKIGGGKSSLVVTLDGYNTVQIPIKNVVSDVLLTPQIKEVQVGYAKQSVETVTVSTVEISGEKFDGRPVTNMTQALQGAIAGLNITQCGYGSDDAYKMNVRGVATIGEGSSGAPLVLIDGVDGDINSVNPSDVESITVLKDTAAATLYGSRAPFGVILIKTKR